MRSVTRCETSDWLVCQNDRDGPAQRSVYYTRREALGRVQTSAKADRMYIVQLAT